LLLLRSWFAEERAQQYRQRRRDYTDASCRHVEKVTPPEQTKALKVGLVMEMYDNA
jgi:hypothetical protein